ncbi:hypothetical protein T05_5960 [Trichinella murrelli]|uniref:Uncharacterized protein n=1 Tax=Trichinella murrelli TaxID=144512 RepID=A0A0V0UCW2_9BILA|nr:hypothetical protein T05_814 [Trichinella murrelli]KRX48929.1 hypothetical protein T05_5960 [Trichinella murrelli]
MTTMCAIAKSQIPPSSLVDCIIGFLKGGKSVRSTIRLQPCHTNYRRNNGQSKPNQELTQFIKHLTNKPGQYNWNSRNITQHTDNYTISNSFQGH